jgi:hypothetical protein
MRNLCHNAARCARIGPRDRLVELGDTEALDDQFLFCRVTDHAPIILDLDLAALFDFFFLCHNSEFVEFIEFLEYVEMVEFLNSMNSTNSINS